MAQGPYRVVKKAGVPAEEMVFGTRAVLEVLLAGQELDKVFVQQRLENELLKELLQACRDHQVPVQRVPLEKLNRFTRKNHQGVVALKAAVTYASLDHIIQQAYEKGEAPLLLMLDRITDVRNFGAIARTAECAGVHGIIIPAKGAAQINSDAVKTSAGALHHIPVCREDYLKKTITYLQESGIQVYACSEKATENVYQTDLTGPACLLMGSEEDGISPAYLDLADQHVLIPMYGNIASLNVGVATSILLFEAQRQRHL